MHDVDRALASAVSETAHDRVRAEPPLLACGFIAAEAAITAGGLGGEGALARLRDVVLPATVAIDHPRYLAFIPSAPAPAAALADLLVSAFSVYGGSWLEGAGAVHA